MYEIGHFVEMKSRMPALLKRLGKRRIAGKSQGLVQISKSVAPIVNIL